MPKSTESAKGSVLSPLNPNRNDRLKKSFNGFWSKFLGSDKGDYYSKMSIKDFVDLKCAISCINNAITLKTTLAFVDYLFDKGIVLADEAKEIKEKVLNTNVNANGFDVEYKNSRICIAAEIKCNIPVGTNSFGAAQEKAILKDLTGLLGGKSKSKIDQSNALKFMVMLNHNHVVESMRKVIHKFEVTHPNQIQELESIPTVLSSDIIYVVYIDSE